MSERLRAVKGLVYPEPNSLELVRNAGGLSKLTAEQRKKVRLRRLKAGDWCDDLPPESVNHLIAKGGVERVQVDEEPSLNRGEGIASFGRRGRKPPVEVKEK